MKQTTIILILYIFFYTSGNAQFKKYFTEESLRIDFILSGNATVTQASIFELKKEPFWGGSTMHTLDAFDYGEFRINVKDSTNQSIIFSRGFCSLFEEWQTTNEANSVDKSFFQTITCPYPKNKVYISIEKRSISGEFKKLLTTEINPNDYIISRARPLNVKFHKVIDNGNSAQCVDIVFIGDGYSKNEMAKFHKDVEQMSKYMFTQAPFDKYQNRFNIWAVDAISNDSGISDPRKEIWKNTVLKSSFNTLNSDRYLESTHTFLIRDYASVVPYDQIYVLANTDKYGGGGIYNHFSLTSVGNKRSKTVFIHEFGHAFAGLGDEYYTSETSYNDYFNVTIEPWQPNLTTLINFDGKWKNMMDNNTPIPTPAKEEYFNKIGVFEGGGYMEKDVYRPAYNCRMKTNEAPAFCPVCQKAIEKMILFLVGE